MCKYGIVLSHDVDGKITDYCKARIDEGIRLYKGGKVDKLIMAGGYISGYKISLAEQMKEYALQNVNVEILLEDISLDTVGQIVFLKEGILDPRKIKEFYLISHHWHIPRVELITYTFFDKSYKIHFVGIEFDENKRREEFGKFKEFINSFGDKTKRSNSLINDLIKNHLWYNGNYPSANLSKEYFIENLKRLHTSRGSR